VARKGQVPSWSYDTIGGSSDSMAFDFDFNCHFDFEWECCGGCRLFLAFDLIVSVNDSRSGRWRGRDRYRAGATIPSAEAAIAWLLILILILIVILILSGSAAGDAGYSWLLI